MWHSLNNFTSPFRFTYRKQIVSPFRRKRDDVVCCVYINRLCARWMQSDVLSQCTWPCRLFVTSWASRFDGQRCARTLIPQTNNQIRRTSPFCHPTPPSPLFAVVSFVHWQSIDSQVAWISLGVWGERPIQQLNRTGPFHRYYRIVNPTSNDAGIISGFWRPIDSSYLFD